MVDSPLSLLTWELESLGPPHASIFGSAFGNSGFLPARTILHTRIPMHSVDCSRCIDPYESVMHALVLCPFASRVWFLSSLCVNIQVFQNKSFIDWLNFWLTDPVTKLPDEDQCLFVAVLWSTWSSRNNLVFQNLKETHLAVLARARAMLLTRKSCLIVSPTTPVSLCDK
ncbi:uncharacterized protein LOC113279086 [Papaver somniferum]|uniref:uncharacterized protein LOC113279086 n=1 Tax=Papaver somniferum TaxID=3469 RepID=UPI000E701953|nr:uncharacterized protein LOC113279086 [Papaver somniferum]